MVPDPTGVQVDPDSAYADTLSRVGSESNSGTITYHGGPNAEPLPGMLPDLPGYHLLSELGPGAAWGSFITPTI